MSKDRSAHRLRGTRVGSASGRHAFCIDRFEFPNRRGAFPVVATTWTEARNACAAEGKRLCTEDEWTFACEGPDALPYPYARCRPSTRAHGEQFAFYQIGFRCCS